MLDNDVVWKLCCFGCHDALGELGACPPAMLQIGRYTLRDKIRRTTKVRDRESVSAALEAMFATLMMLRPDTTELELAIELEDKAARLGMDFDSGESQLLAVLIVRSWPLLITGDKRAITAIGAILGGEVDGKVACLEQLIARVITIRDVGEVRAGICGEPAMDRALANCFACASKTIDPASVAEGLASYINDVRRMSGRVLIAESDLARLA